MAILATIQFMVVANVTVVNLALPSMRADLHLTDAGLAWVVNSYLVAAGGMLLLGGRLGDVLGRRRMLALGTALFGAASLAAGVTANAAALIASRFAQGLGVALIAPAALSLVVVAFPAGRDRARAMGLWGGLSAIGGVAGLLLSGLLTDLAGWSWVFLINVPVAVVALASLPRLVEESRAPGGRLDAAGAVLATCGLAAILVGLLAASSRPWHDAEVFGPVSGGLTALTLLVLVERRASEPLLPPRFFTSRSRSVAVLAMMLMTGAMASMFLMLTLFMSTVLEFSPIRLGVAYLPFSVVLVAALASAAPLAGRFDSTILASVSFAVAAIGLLLLSRSVDANGADFPHLVAATMVIAIGFGVGMPTLQCIALDRSESDAAGLAAGILTCAQQLGAAVGLSVLTMLASKTALDVQSRGTPELTAAAAGYQSALQVAAFSVAAGAALSIFVDTRMTVHPRGSRRRHRPRASGRHPITTAARGTR